MALFFPMSDLGATTYVVYGLTFPCKKLYIGRMIRPLRERFGERHLGVEKGLPQYSVSRHFAQSHGKYASALKVFGLQTISHCYTKGEMFSMLCRQETYWIYKLHSLAPNGLNLELNFTTILRYFFSVGMFFLVCFL